MDHGVYCIMRCACVFEINIVFPIFAQYTRLIIRKWSFTFFSNIDYLKRFLRAIGKCFARLNHGLGFCPSVCLSVRHTAVITLYQNGASENREIFTMNSIFFVTKFRAPGWGGFSRTRASKRGTSLKDVILQLFAFLVWKRLQIGIQTWANHNKLWW